MPLTVSELRQVLDTCLPDDEVVVAATLADGSAISVRELDLGTGQGGPDGECIDLVISWEPGAEAVARP